MGRALAGLLLALAAVRAPAAAQAGNQPTMVLSIFAGVQTGYSLWSVGRQPLCVLDPQNACSANFDTLAVSRSAASALVAGLTVMYFPRPRVGVFAQLGYQGFPLDDDCTSLFHHPDPDDPFPVSAGRNEQVCNSIRSTSVPGGSMSGLVGIVARTGMSAPVSPFLRAGLGIISRPQSSVQLEGDYAISTTANARRIVILDESPTRTLVAVLASVGITARLGPGYQFRLELRDLMSGVDAPTGPADAGGLAPSSSQFTHSLALTVALDIVLERRHRRRY